MVLYAREDVTYVLVPAGNGGCGQPHTRPVANGAPAKEFKLACQPCENFLRADIARTGNKKVRTVNSDNGMKLAERYMGLWGASPETVPETPDAEKQREWNSDRTALENAATQTEAFGRIADALAGNQELILKLAEMVTASKGAFGSLSPILPVPADDNPMPEPRKWQYPVGAIPDVDTSTWNQRACLDCSAPIVRKDGQKGALPQRCPDCKAKKAAARRKAA